ncbi:hypothetical protein NE547_18250, partial [Flavonifractor sp. DFI.6.63]|uniref:hypothetical protein n=1 Tax=Flavonifractor sp. DFI.6.63 TaxID=2963704 RepID=UPI0035226334|nr:hypothetical protein [Flavonifractor sp. DFI.6.63]
MQDLHEAVIKVIAGPEKKSRVVINTLTEGDYLYLQDSEQIYQYLWECTAVIEPSNWGPIYNQGYACVTLTTCTPIGVADHQPVVR